MQPERHRTQPAPTTPETHTEEDDLLKVPGYAYLLSARLFTSLILWVDFTLIFSMLSEHWQASASAVGTASALYGLPGLALGPFFGRLADRCNPLSVLLGSYLARGLTSFLLMMAPSLEIFVFLVFLKGLGNVAVMPAEQVLIRAMLNRAQIVSSTGLMTAMDQLTKIGAPMLGALTATFGAASAGFALSALFSAGGLVCLLALRQVRSDLAGDVNPSRPTARLSALLHVLKDQQDFRWAFFIMLLQTAVLSLYDPLLALFLKERGFPPGTFGIIVSCTAIGAMAGALLFKRLFSWLAHRHLMALALTGFGLTVLIPGLLAAAGQPLRVQLMLSLWLGNGALYGLTAMSFGILMQGAAAESTLGTVSATARSAQLLLLVLGPLVGSGLARLAGIPLVFVLSGLLACGAGVLSLAFWRAGAR